MIKRVFNHRLRSQIFAQTQRAFSEQTEKVPAPLPLLTEEEITEKKAQIGSDPYPIMEIKPEALKKFQTNRKMLFFVNMPLIVGIPALIEFGLDPVHKEMVDNLYLVLTCGDFMLCFNSIMIYQTLKRMVSSIHYLPSEDKLQIKQFSSSLLAEKVVEREPQDIEKCKNRTFNPFIGYRMVTNANEKYATESTAVWHDR